MNEHNADRWHEVLTELESAIIGLDDANEVDITRCVDKDDPPVRYPPPEWLGDCPGGTIPQLDGAFVPGEYYLGVEALDIQPERGPVSFAASMSLEEKRARINAYRRKRRRAARAAFLEKQRNGTTNT